MLELDAAAEELLLTSDEKDRLVDDVIVPASTLAGSKEEMFSGSGSVKFRGGKVRFNGGGPVKFAP